MIFPADWTASARRILDGYGRRGWSLATAESCTGGLVSALLTSIPGSSSVVERGFVTYSNAAKSKMLWVSAALIDRDGAVSEAVARAMAEGAVRESRAHVAVAITGIAGPGGGSAAKPVGLVHLACATRGAGCRHLERRYGELGRDAVRAEAVNDALALLEAALTDMPQPGSLEAGSRP